MDAYERTLQLMSGGTIVAHGLIGLFFLRWWKTTGERLFAVFAVAFWVLGANRIAIAYWGDEETKTYLYFVRLAAYLLILYAIWDKNRARAPR
jgi:hypothetical protein